MIGAGLVEVFIGVDAEQKSLEDLAEPVSAVSDGEGDDAQRGVPSSAQPAPARDHGLGPVPAGTHPFPRPIAAGARARQERMASTGRSS